MNHLKSRRLHRLGYRANLKQNFNRLAVSPTQFVNNVAILPKPSLPNDERLGYLSGTRRRRDFHPRQVRYCPASIVGYDWHTSDTDARETLYAPCAESCGTRPLALIGAISRFLHIGVFGSVIYKFLNWVAKYELRNWIPSRI